MAGQRESIFLELMRRAFSRHSVEDVYSTYDGDDERDSQATGMKNKLQETVNRAVNINRRHGQRHHSKPQEPSPPPPINRRRSTRMKKQGGNPPQRLKVPDINLTLQSQSHDRGGRDTSARGWTAPNPLTPEPAKSLPGAAGPPNSLTATALEIGRPGAAESERSRPSRATLVTGLHRPVSKEASQRLSFSSWVLGDKVRRYTPLRAEEFRLVRVLAARSSQVKCEILHRPFRDPPSYIAISYAWGDSSDTTKIMIRYEHSPLFVEVHISKSLYYALEALRRKGEDVLVWADALSIDQQNRDEKNEQLSLMADIYKKA